MDAELKGKWVKALRSGKYKQGAGYLNSVRGFCCLGVLCDISGLGKWHDIPTVDMECRQYVFDDARSRTTIPPVLAVTMGLPSLIIGPLVNMNDDGETFAKIADFIEANL